MEEKSRVSHGSMTKKDLLGDDWITEEEMAKLRGLSVATLVTHRSRGKAPPFFKDGKTVWYSVSGYRQWAADQSSKRSRPHSRRRR